jgi:hypothetical protein
MAVNDDDDDDGYDVADISRLARVHALAGFHCPRYPAFFPDWWPLKDQWPVPGRAYIVECLRRQYGEENALRFRRTSSLFTLH